jgi:hypothetical protein
MDYVFKGSGVNGSEFLTTGRWLLASCCWPGARDQKPEAKNLIAILFVYTLFG